MGDGLEHDLEMLAGRRVLFGHQSVGGNILDGLRVLLRRSGRELPIVEPPPADGAARFDGAESGVLVHAKVGRNADPQSKLDAFRELADAVPQVDVALMKLCYVDFDERTDADALFTSYHDTLTDLARRHPSTAFVAVTAPLRQTPSGPGVLVRALLGRPNRGKRENLIRHRFNERIRRAYPGTRLFDLAALEATRPDGRRESFRYQGQPGEGLTSAYTDDGGHLNEAGREIAARAFVRSLAAAAASLPRRA